MLQSILVNKFTLGADPEFVLVSASGAVTHSQYPGSSREIGTDGPLVELRPRPSSTAYGLTKNIAELLSNLSRSTDAQYKWKAGAFYAGCPMGGHVHFSQANFPLPSILSCTSANSQPTFKQLHRLTSRLEYLDILPRRESMQRRLESGYGRVCGAIRKGDDYPTWEYRKMPSWLFHPRITFLCLTLAKLVAAHPEVFAEVQETGFNRLVKFVEKFKEKDFDAAILAERILPAGLKKIKADPTADFKTFWKNWKPLEE